MSATTSSKCMSPPPMCATRPISHKTRRITRIVQSISPSPFVQKFVCQPLKGSRQPCSLTWQWPCQHSRNEAAQGSKSLINRFYGQKGVCDLDLFGQIIKLFLYGNRSQSFDARVLI